MFFNLRIRIGEFLMKIGHLAEMTTIYYPERERDVYFGRTIRQWKQEQKLEEKSKKEIGCK